MKVEVSEPVVATDDDKAGCAAEARQPHLATWHLAHTTRPVGGVLIPKVRVPFDRPLAFGQAKHCFLSFTATERQTPLLRELMVKLPAFSECSMWGSCRAHLLSVIKHVVEYATISEEHLSGSRGALAAA